MVVGTRMLFSGQAYRDMSRQAEGSRERPPAGLIQVAKANFRALVVESPHGGGSDSVRSARDQRHFVL